MRYVLPVIFALQIGFSPLCMREAAAQTPVETPQSMASMDHMHHAMGQMASHSHDQSPCGHGHCFSESGLESAPAPHVELPATMIAALPPPAIITDISAEFPPLPAPEEPPPIVAHIETTVLLQ